MNYRSVFTLIFFFFALGVFVVNAQTIDVSAPLSSTGLLLSASTDNPIPGQTVTITAKSYSADIDASKIIWTVNGKVAQSGVGSTVFQIKAPSLGKKITIDVSAETPTGNTMLSSIVISSGSIDLIIETDGYTPPFFNGKIAPVYQNLVKVIAVPHIANSSGTEYNPKDLVYQWEKNGRAIEGQSGYGQQALTLKGDIVPRGYDLTVTVWPRDNGARAEGKVSINLQSPLISFYKDDPLYGTLFNLAIGDTIRIGSTKEVSVYAVPFGFNKPGPESNTLRMSWFINGDEHPELSTNDLVVLRAPEDAGGESSISLDIVNTREILQKASAALSAIFKPVTQSNQVTF